jgi:hypothetical protein
VNGAADGKRVRGRGDTRHRSFQAASGPHVRLLPRRQGPLRDRPRDRRAWHAGEEDPGAILATLLAALAPGSYLVVTHLSPEDDPVGVRGLERTYREGGMTLQSRTAGEFADLAFPGLQLVPPGVVLVSEWRPDEDGPRPRPADVGVYGGVARKPPASR